MSNANPSTTHNSGECPVISLRLVDAICRSSENKVVPRRWVMAVTSS